jgi:hypothetical protein
MVDPSNGVSSSRRRALLGLGALAILLLAVAVASTGSIPTHSGAARRPSDRFLDVAVSLFMIWMAFGLLLWIYVLVARRDVIAEAAAARRRRSLWASALSLAVGVALLALLARWLLLDERLRARIAGGIGGSSSSTADNLPAASADYRPQFATGPVLVVLALLAVAIAGWYLAYRARLRRLPPEPQLLQPVLADVLDETLDDLRAETDPRRAVIAAYVRMERVLAAYGLPRSPSEAPEEYLQRILGDLDVSRHATARLTALFGRARFSSHDVGPEMKQDAITALEAVREELRAAEILAAREHDHAVAGLRERAAR